MSEKNVKFLRGQVRQVVKELLPEVLHTESVGAVRKELESYAATRLDNLTKMVKQTLDQVDQRSKDTQSYVIRAVTPMAPAGASEQQPSPEKTE